MLTFFAGKNGVLTLVDESDLGEDGGEVPYATLQVGLVKAEEEGDWSR